MRLTERETPPVVGILYAGEMGSSLGRILREDGLRVVTTLAGRSPRTERLCREAGLEVLPTLDDVAAVADVIVSVVSPAAALAVARDYAARAARQSVFIDANAVSATTMQAIAAMLAGQGIACVDAAINGLASFLRSGAVVYLSGTQASEVARWFGRTLKIQVVGDTPGKASALKGALAGLSKGLAALFVEVAGMAHEAGVGDFFLQRCRAFYPGVMEVVERMLPTYPQHARRRGEELAELEAAMHALGLRADIVGAAGTVTRALGKTRLERSAEQPRWTTGAVLDAVAASGALALSEDEANATDDGIPVTRNA